MMVVDSWAPSTWSWDSHNLSKKHGRFVLYPVGANRSAWCRVKNGESLADMPHIPSAPDPSLIPCPHCGRRFNAKAAERHIPSCATTINKPKFLKAGTGGSGQGAPKLLDRVPRR